MKNINYFYYIIFIFALFLISYEIYKYGLRGYFNRRTDRKRRQYNLIYNTIQKI
jgi:hypothetical protein